ncbi:hypothetical protein RIR_jg19259.t1 [Rhizophagus irregularis DAOM 181602=DAOM 197198]|nr:hypothetical protein RIR_jg19259.t1 [Rhizophagus irregularis DAOM 181602=DAOM 197198]
MNLSLRHQHPSTIKIVVCNKNIRCSFGHFTINIRRENLSKKPSSCTYNVLAELNAVKMKYNVKFMGVIVKISTIPITLVDSTSDLQCLHFRSWYV